jgi:hypothetical protein
MGCTEFSGGTVQLVFEDASASRHSRKMLNVQTSFAPLCSQRLYTLPARCQYTILLQRSI